MESTHGKSKHLQNLLRLLVGLPHLVSEMLVTTTVWDQTPGGIEMADLQFEAFINEVMEQVEDYCSNRDAEIKASLIKTLISRLTFIRP